jgi:hypothetical protein
MSDDGTQTISAAALRRGDRIHLPRGCGRCPGGSQTVLGMWTNDTGVTVQTRTGDHEYRNTDTVTIDKREP